MPPQPQLLQTGGLQDRRMDGGTKSTGRRKLSVKPRLAVMLERCGRDRDLLWSVSLGDECPGLRLRVRGSKPQESGAGTARRNPHCDTSSPRQPGGCDPALRWSQSRPGLLLNFWSHQLLYASPLTAADKPPQYCPASSCIWTAARDHLLLAGQSTREWHSAEASLTSLT